MLLLSYALAQQAAAHARGETWSTIDVKGAAVTVTYSIEANELVQRLPDIAFSGNLEDRLLTTVADRFRLMSAGELCRTRDAVVRQSARTVDVTWQVHCQDPGDLTVVDDALFERLPNHLHISQARFGDRDGVEEKLFTRHDRRWRLTADAPSGLVPTFVRYLGLGVDHIVSGYDHLAFLLAMILLAPRLATLVLMITGFTIGHSITLALAVLGYATADRGTVEALIGFTIALVAAEAVAVRHDFQRALLTLTATGLLLLALIPNVGPGVVTLSGLGIFSVCYLLLMRYRELEDLINPMLTLLFGMVHGFGFASFLLQTGLPVQSVVPALVGFNLGVEVGQLGALAAAFAAVYTGRKLFPPVPGIPEATASVLCGLGLFWFVSRALV